MPKNKVREYRENQGYSQQELADELGVSRETISRVELGKHEPSLTLARLLAIRFQTPIDSLFADIWDEFADPEFYANYLDRLGWLVEAPSCPETYCSITDNTLAQDALIRFCE